MKALPWWPQLEASCGGRVALVDGDAMFNRPGPRLVDAYEWLVATLQAIPLPSTQPISPQPTPTPSLSHILVPTSTYSHTRRHTHPQPQPKPQPSSPPHPRPRPRPEPHPLQALPHAAPPDFPVEWVSANGSAAAAAESASARVQRLRAELAAAEAELAAEEQSAVAAIEELHLCAVRQGQHSYKDPKTGDHPC